VNLTRDLLEGLNSEQHLAVARVRGPLRIVAGAGTGKTRTLTHRFAHLVEQGIPPDRILALTFSRRAAGEFRTKTLDLLDASYAHLWISTFHGFCLRVMREERGVFGNPRVMGEAEQRRVIARAVRYDPHAEARTYYVGPTGEQRLVADALTLISRTKDESISLTGFVEYADQRGMELSKKQDRDGYKLFLNNLLLGTYGKDLSTAIRITFHSADGHDICEVTVKPSSRPIYVKEDKGQAFYVRAGNQTVPLSMEEMFHYCRTRWG